MELIVIFGPPAVGKMTVGLELEKATGIKLFHNHMSIEPVLRFFPYGSSQFSRLVNGFRNAIFEEVANSDLPGLCFTYVWDLDEQSDADFVASTCQLFESKGARINLVELEATIDARLERNKSELRLTHKPSKRNVRASESHLLDVEAKHTLNTSDSNNTLALPFDHLKIDSTNLSAQETAEVIVSKLGLSTASS